MHPRQNQKTRYAQQAEEVRVKNDRRDQARADLQDRRAAEQRALWEENTHQRNIRNAEQRRLNQLQAADASTLVARRRALADLLNSEFGEWEREIEARVPTIDDFKADLRHRALALRQEREAERLALVQEKLEQQQRMSLDDVRTLDSNRVTREVAEKRREQFAEKEAREAEERKRATEDHKHVLKLQREKNKRHNDDIRRIRERNEETKGILDQQLYLYRAAKEREAEERAEEAAKLARMWNEEQELAARREQEERMRQQTERVRVQAFNKSKFDERAKAAAREREIDLKLLHSELERQRREIEAEENAKRQFQEENRRYRELLEQQMIKEKEDMSMVDRAINNYNDQVQAKRDAELAARDHAREALMTEVMASREEELRIKARRAEEQLTIDKELTRLKVIEDRRKEDEELAKEELRRESNRAHQRYLQRQREDKLRRQQAEEQEKYLEHRRMVRTEQEYARQLEYLKNKPVTRNFGLKTSTREF